MGCCDFMLALQAIADLTDRADSGGWVHIFAEGRVWQEVREYHSCDFGVVLSVLFCSSVLFWSGVGLVWSGLVWSGLVWSGLVRSGVVWSGLVWSGLVLSGPVWSALLCSALLQPDCPFHQSACVSRLSAGFVLGRQSTA